MNPHKPIPGTKFKFIFVTTSNVTVMLDFTEVRKNFINKILKLEPAKPIWNHQWTVLSHISSTRKARYIKFWFRMTRLPGKYIKMDFFFQRTYSKWRDVQRKVRQRVQNSNCFVRALNGIFVYSFWCFQNSGAAYLENDKFETFEI